MHSTIAQSDLLILSKKFSAPPHFKEEGRDYALYMTYYKEDTFTTIPYDRYFIYRTARS